ncbi:M23 family metallopeptidase [Litoribrevibacter albus]|uniref:Periplasmic metalloprotease M23B family protein n=1 Tax=Litoribrevibacter albus TaxID=1473156 RepID=A0AA37W8A3_9GAMM|nr:M23 family metallopeptidase [Litoribrevibacter albus]GLQ33642.1 periplasmic metalloprotease M23B family protein [Litoribrevibacter albus]
MRRLLWGISIGLLFAFGVQAKESALVEWQGSFKQGALLIGHLTSDEVVSIRTSKRTLIINGERSFGLGLGRDFGPTLDLIFKMKDGREVARQYSVEAREYKIQKVEGVPQRTVTPDPEHLKRIRAEAAKVRKARANSGDMSHYMESFIWPAKGLISGVYGSQRFYNGEPRRPHFGLDIAAPEGSPVIAPASGVVVLAEKDLFFSGGTVVIDHGHGISSSFLHMSKLDVKVGQSIKQGEKVGEIGSTGRATGAHLDWRMNWFDQRVDPRLLMKESVPPKK